MCFNAGVHTLEEIPASFLVAGLGWLKTVDITETRSEVNSAHWKCTKSLASVHYCALDPLSNEEQLVVIDDENMLDELKFG